MNFELWKKLFEVRMKSLENAITILINCYLLLSIILFSVHLLAPIFGGILLYYAIVKYGSWVGAALTLKYIQNIIKNKSRMKIISWIFISLYFSLCMFLWFTYPYNILFFLVMIVGTLVGYKSQEKWQNGPPK